MPSCYFCKIKMFVNLMINIYNIVYLVMYVLASEWFLFYNEGRLSQQAWQNANLQTSLPSILFILQIASCISSNVDTLQKEQQKYIKSQWQRKPLIENCRFLILLLKISDINLFLLKISVISQTLLWQFHFHQESFCLWSPFRCTVPIYRYCTYLQVLYLSIGTVPIYRYCTYLQVLYLSIGTVPIYRYCNYLQVLYLSIGTVPIYRYCTSLYLFSACMAGGMSLFKADVHEKILYVQIH